MTDTTTREARGSVQMTRHFDAPPEEVFRAWTDPAEIAEWYGPQGWHAPAGRIHVDGQVGGRWALTMVRRSDGFEFPIGYEIVELVAPRLLVLHRTESDPGGSEATIVRVELKPDGDGTLLTLSDGPMPVEGVDHAGNGYSQAFAKLAARLDTGRRSTT